MSSDNQFTALGPAIIGFQTHGANIDVGADISGNQVGVRGRCQSAVGDGVQGFGTGNFSGTAGFGADGNSGVGAFGQGGAPNGDGVRGVGRGQAGAGVRGVSGELNGNGVIGEASNGTQAFGVWGRSTTGFAGNFDGRVRVNGDFEVHGAKAAVVPLADGTIVRLYSLECPDSWFEDFGIGRLVAGEAAVELDPEFAAVVTDEPYHVFVSEYEDNNALYVTRRTGTGFLVRAKTPDAGGEFSYRVVARRRDVSARRFERVTAVAEKPASPEVGSQPYRG